MNEYDKIIVQTMALVAARHGCHLTNVDICRDKTGQRVGLIEIDGPSEKQDELAMAIEDALKQLEIKAE